MRFGLPRAPRAAGIAAHAAGAVLGALGILGAWSVPGDASAQAAAAPVSMRLLCTNHGANAIEPVADREGQSLLAAAASCVVQGGPMDGGVETQHNLWHYDRGAGTLLSGQAVARKPGALSASLITQGALTFQMSEGRMTGWSASGRGRLTLATGGAAALDGKSFAWTASPTGPRSYVVQVTFAP